MGAIAGATLVWLYFLPHWSVTPEADLKRACFCTSPAIRRPASNLLCEIIGTFVLVLVVSAIFSKAVAAGGPAAGLGPYLVASLVWGIGLSLGGTTGYAINPARDLGRGSRTRCCPWRARAVRIGAMRPSPWQVHCSAAPWRACSRGWPSSSGSWGRPSFSVACQRRRRKTIVCATRYFLYVLETFVRRWSR